MSSPGNPAQRFAYDGKMRHYWVPQDGIANPAAPTAAELTAEGVFDFSKYIPKTGGVTGDPTQNYVDSGDITDTFDSQQVGTYGFQPTIEAFRQDPDDNFADFFATTKKGYWVNIFNGDDDSPKDGDRANVMLVENHIAVPLPATTNEKQRCRVGMAVLEEPYWNVSIVAS